MHTNVSVVQDTPETNVNVSSVYMILFVRKVMNWNHNLDIVVPTVEI
jgi:hypothetical protein